MSAPRPPSRSCSGSSSWHRAALRADYEMQHPFWMLGFLVLTAVTFSLFGFIIGIWADGFEKLQIVPLLVVTPLTFLGGSFYSIDMLPPFWQKVTLFNPVVYLISGFRWSFYGRVRRRRRRQPRHDAGFLAPWRRVSPRISPEPLRQRLRSWFRGGLRRGLGRRLGGRLCSRFLRGACRRRLLCHVFLPRVSGVWWGSKFSTDSSPSGRPTANRASVRPSPRWRRRDGSRRCCSRRGRHAACAPRTAPRRG
jgi:hypothetical protein